MSAGTFCGVQFHLLIFFFRSVLCQFAEHSKQLPHSMQVLLALCKECDYFPVYLCVCLIEWSIERFVNGASESVGGVQIYSSSVSKAFCHHDCFLSHEKHCKRFGYACD